MFQFVYLIYVSTLCFNLYFNSMFQSMFQLYVSIYVSIISIDTKRRILFYNYKSISRISFTSVKFYQCFRRNNYGLGSLVAIYMCQVRLPPDRTITRKIKQTHPSYILHKKVYMQRQTMQVNIYIQGCDLQSVAKYICCSMQ